MSESDQEFRRPNNTELSRRDLFRSAGLAAGGAMLLGLPTLLSSLASPAEAAIKNTSFLRNNTALELDGQFAGFLTTVDGGGVFADVISETIAQDMIQRKRPGPVRFEDIVIEIPLGSVDKLLAGWISETLGKSPVQKNGAIIYADANFNEIKRLEFSGALLSEISLPEADAAVGKNQALLTLRLTPQSTRLTGGKGKLPGGANTKTKQIITSNFRFNVQGLEKACARITSVDPISAKRAMLAQNQVGDAFRQVAKAPGPLEYSLVRITLPESEAGAFYAWFDETVIKGKPNGERAGLLEWLDPTLKNVMASVQLGGLGIVRYEPDPSKSNEQKIGLVEVDMYCETLNLTL
ncbi:MAG: hypothetical protein H8K08_05980 [Nitrospira sp.]|nr:hypothetical protein [Nitrospira sp.]